MKITLNIHGTLARFYRSFWNKEDLPNNLCNYFWSLVLAFVFTPVIWPMLLINWGLNPIKYDKDEQEYYNARYRTNSAYGLLINILFLFVGALATETVYGKSIFRCMSFLKIYTNGVVVCVTIVAGLALIILGCYGVSILIERMSSKAPAKNWETEDETEKRWEEANRLRELKEAKRQKSFWYLTKKMFMAWKEKNCPIIDWKK